MPIQLQQISFSYDTAPVLQRLSITLPDTGAVCLFGPSGCGKTTLLRLLAGLERPQEGRITGLSDRRIAMVFQEDRLLPWKTAADNVALPLHGEDARERALAALAAVGLADAADARPAALSGGMKRRVAIARAMAMDADCLLLDEPFSGLDRENWQPIATHLRALSKSRLIVLVTHIEEEAAAIGAQLLPLSC